MHNPLVPLWRNLSFTLMWTSTAASGFGDRMMMLSALALLGGMAAGGDATAVQASTQFWFFLAYVVFSIPGGYLADRLPRKWLLLGCDEARGLVLMLAFGLLASAVGPAHLPDDQHWKVYATLFAVGCFAAIFNPTRNAIIPQIVARPQLPGGNAIVLVINVIASQVGMLIGGRLILPEHASSVRTGLLIGALFYLVSGLFFAFLKTDATTPAARRAASAPGQAGRYVLQHRKVIALIGINVLVWASAATVTSAILGLAKTHYHLQGEGLLLHYTQVSATLGVGLLLGAALITAIRTRQEVTLVIMTSLIFAGACVGLLAMVPWWGVTYLAALGIGLFGNVVIVAVMSMLQSICPNAMRGRVMGINAMVNTVCSVATYFVIWRLPHADVNIRLVLYVLGPTLMILGGVGLWRELGSGPMPSPMGNLFRRLTRLFTFSYHRLTIVGKHHIPQMGPVILAANHTTGLDPFLMQAGSRRLIRWVMLTSYQTRWANPLWRAIEPIALDLDSGDLSKLRDIIRVLKNDQLVGLFPEGELQREHRELAAFQPGVAMIALRSRATIVPTWIDGTPRRHSLFWHFFQPSHCTIQFGSPWTPDRSMTHEQVTTELRRRLEVLRDSLAEGRESSDTTG